MDWRVCRHSYCQATATKLQPAIRELAKGAQNADSATLLSV